MKNIGEETAAICGLFCGTCPSYPHECKGCLSDKLALDCSSCHNGFRDCVKERNVVRCYECSEFPCKRLESFSKKHIVNGICHHKNVIKDLEYMKNHSVSDWVSKQIKNNTCSKCGKLMHWYDANSHKCDI